MGKRSCEDSAKYLLWASFGLCTRPFSAGSGMAIPTGAIWAKASLRSGICGAPPRIRDVRIAAEDQAYGPINGTDEMREAVANHYNRLFRSGMRPYRKENVGIAQGGRLMLSRVFAALSGKIGYQIPDYTAYQDMMDYAAQRCSFHLLPTTEANHFSVSAATFDAAVRELDLDAYLVSNPCNPTGHVIRGETLESYCETARQTGCTLLLDEFYSHFIYDGAEAGTGAVTAASHVQDPDTDPVLIIDGLTKSFRYPGWRLGWVLGPPEVVETLGRAASAIDGGPSRVTQRIALKALESAQVDQETSALRTEFAKKREMMVRRLTQLGIRCLPGDSTFYVWGCLDELPNGLNTGKEFFWNAIERKVMTVPGEFFDVNPGRSRTGSPFSQWMRFSFGPSMANVDLGLTRLEEMVAEAKA
jgi:aspartate/methionine/tyrosine aminotransferase